MINAFLPVLKGTMQGGLLTMEPVRVIDYRAGDPAHLHVAAGGSESARHCPAPKRSSTNTGHGRGHYRIAALKSTVTFRPLFSVGMEMIRGLLRIEVGSGANDDLLRYVNLWQSTH